jgi:glycerol-3-phosphate dehydrogenase (NAD(P)+)
VSLIKGVDVDSLRFGSQLISDALDCDPGRVVVVSGPNLARECAARLPAASVAASPELWRAERVQAAVMAPYFRVYTNEDKVGVEVAGAVKNVIAIAAGMAHGHGVRRQHQGGRPDPRTGRDDPARASHSAATR